jgi:(1->4)-alpha-D-glucan 1-alpha-D-glucosylmutase
MREASDGTGWTDPDEDFETAVHEAIDRCYDDPELRRAVQLFIDLVRPYGRSNSLSQKAIQLTQPGIPDVYQGTELWEDSLVDPDNRRPVDFGRHRTLLAELDAAATPPAVDESGAAKLWITSRILRARRDHPDLYGDYRPIYAEGSGAGYLVGFDRGGAITVATRLPATLARAGGWHETTVALDGRYTDVLTGREFDQTVRADELLAIYPVAHLIRHD